MIVAGQRLPILIATRPVDFRCGHQALALMMQTELKLDPHSGVTVIFRSKRGDRLKILVWDGTGMVLTYKILEHGSFAWPKVQDGTMRLSRGQYEALFEGLDWRRVMAQRVTAPSAAGSIYGCLCIVLFGFFVLPCYKAACLHPLISACFRTFRQRW
ncbi:IS66 family insertion sequence element accessory protein TnpB [Sinorhizobium meliloti]|nr:IS66 family insertion sequence element accessory protein TnpB [Sinorhizobium meliloti]MDE3761362.1 IS66 family insertion sequence element accessory protein TnpB [Sinorhizobium meliloti]